MACVSTKQLKLAQKSGTGELTASLSYACMHTANGPHEEERNQTRRRIPACMQPDSTATGACHKGMASNPIMRMCVCVCVHGRIPFVPNLSISCVVETGITDIHQYVAGILPPSDQLLAKK